MINEPALRDLLIALVKDAKLSYELLGFVSAELEALRETVRGLDPTFADVLEANRKKARESRASAESSVSVHAYDLILREVEKVFERDETSE